MRISDWSSDVCSSNLARLAATRRIEHRAVEAHALRPARRHRRLAALEVGVLSEQQLHGSAYRFQFSQSGTGRPFSRRKEIVRASCRESVCQYVYISVVAVSLK